MKSSSLCRGESKGCQRHREQVQENRRGREYIVKLRIVRESSGVWNTARTARAAPMQSKTLSAAAGKAVDVSTRGPSFWRPNAGRDIWNSMYVFTASQAKHDKVPVIQSR